MFDIKCMEEKEVKNMNPQVLAFVGDGVYSLFVRHKLVLTSGLKGKDLHNLTTSYVKAGGQSNSIGNILPLLNETEMSVFKRARNHKTLSQSKNANIVDYRRATGFEAVLGYLYLIGDVERLNFLLHNCLGENDEG